MNPETAPFRIELGVKSDPVEYRYSYEWLFRLMERKGVRHLQLGSFFELYQLPDAWFKALRARAADHDLEAVARRNYERLVEVAALVGARHVGSNPGAVYRDRMEEKEAGIARYVGHMKELSRKARGLGLSALTVEPMSCLAEPPTTAAEIRDMMRSFAAFHAADPEGTAPVLLCGDISHGHADESRRVLEGNVELFEAGIPWMCEFHLKNTDAVFGSTFGFGPDELRRGIVDLPALFALARRREADWPVRDPVAYLEIGGPKTGRDWSDHLLGRQLEESLDYAQEALR
jgi:ribulose-phosphate 3-epimerase